MYFILTLILGDLVSYIASNKSSSCPWKYAFANAAAGELVKFFYHIKITVCCY